MPHHFTKDTVEASVWCNTCGRLTPHRVVDGRRDFCKVCMAKAEEDINKRKAQPERPIQQRLF